MSVFKSASFHCSEPRCWECLVRPSLFFAGTIYYEELFLKLYSFHSLSLSGAWFTLSFTVPIALLLGLLCGGVSVRRGRVLLPLCTGVLSLWIGAQAIYYNLFQTFLTVFSLTKMGMVAGAFGDMAANEVLLNWFPVLMMAAPVLLAILLRKRLILEAGEVRGLRVRWAALAVACQLLAMGVVMLCGGGVLSPRYLYLYAAAPELEAQSFGILTQTQLEVRRVLFGIKPSKPERPEPERPGAETPDGLPVYSSDAYQVMDVDFPALIAGEKDEELLEAHRWFAQREPTEKNRWTGRFQGKNLVWIVAEGFSTLAMDPVRTPTLWQLSHQGFIFDHFYTPLWGVSTSDGEYVTTTGLIPKSGVWSYSQSAANYMPFALGNQLRREGYQTFAFHDYLYDYYDRNLSHPNMGYDYRAIGQGLTQEDVIPPENIASGALFPPSDQMMMEKIVPMFAESDPFAVYCLTVSGHLNYTLAENAMSVRHWDQVKDLPYSEPVKCYLASQIELELAVRSLLQQLAAAEQLENTVLVLSADHYPYGLNDQQYSELLGHPVDPVFERYENTLILWSADMEHPIHVKKYCSSLDVMPTLANLFGLEYDSRLVMGQDIFSSQPGLVIFSNYSFIVPEGYYNSITDQYTRWDGQPPNMERAAKLVAEVQDRVAYSAVILDRDYYRLALNGPPRAEKPVFSLDRKPKGSETGLLEALLGRRREG